MVGRGCRRAIWQESGRESPEPRSSASNVSVFQRAETSGVSLCRRSTRTRHDAETPTAADEEIAPTFNRDTVAYDCIAAIAGVVCVVEPRSLPSARGETHAGGGTPVRKASQGRCHGSHTGSGPASSAPQNARFQRTREIATSLAAAEVIVERFIAKPLHCHNVANVRRIAGTSPPTLSSRAESGRSEPSL